MYFKKTVQKFPLPIIIGAAEAKFSEELMKMFEQTDFYDVIDSGQVFMRVSEAVDASERKRSFFELEFAIYF